MKRPPDATVWAALVIALSALGVSLASLAISLVLLVGAVH